MEDMGPLPSIHPREEVTRKAELKLRGLLLEWMTSEEAIALTTTEYLCVAHAATDELVGQRLKYCLRQERHGDSDKPAGWE